MSCLTRPGAIRIGPMTTLVVSHESFLGHDTGPYHPEQPARLNSVLAGLGQDTFRDLKRAIAEPASAEQIARVHPGDYLNELLAAMPHEGLSHIDADTVISPGSQGALLRAAGAVV